MTTKDQECKAIITKEIVEVCEPIEKLTADQLIKAKEQQLSVIQKMKELTESLNEIESILPPSNLQKTTERINQLCMRIERCKYRIQNVNKRAEIMLNNLSKSKPPQKSGKLIELV